MAALEQEELVHLLGVADECQLDVLVEVLAAKSVLEGADAVARERELREGDCNAGRWAPVVLRGPASSVDAREGSPCTTTSIASRTWRLDW